MDDDFKLICIIIFVCGATICGCVGFFSAFHIGVAPGNGQQIGYIAEVENSGIVWRPDEITLIGSEATFSEAQTSWDYASNSPEITDLARTYLKNHKKVIVHYETVLVAYGWEYSGATRITGIEECGGA